MKAVLGKLSRALEKEALVASDNTASTNGSYGRSNEAMEADDIKYQAVWGA
jgi:hypothetical protein